MASSLQVFIIIKDFFYKDLQPLSQEEKAIKQQINAYEDKVCMLSGEYIGWYIALLC